MDTETKVWRYVVPVFKEGEGEKGFDRGQWWGIFLIDNGGTFTAVTDAGNYAYCWGHSSNTGYPDFRQFLVSLSTKYPDYILGKLCGHTKKEYDPVATLAAVKREIFSVKNRHKWTTKDVGEKLSELKVYNNLHFECDFNEWYYGPGSYADPSECYKQERYPSQAVFFLNKIFRRLQTQLIADLQAEGLAVPKKRWEEEAA